uniref:Uncharacterized protein n=1 Tax=Oryza nivara TaxID=4536 RepID=A0A0E0HP50_ORYNI
MVPIISTPNIIILPAHLRTTHHCMLMVIQHCLLMMVLLCRLRNPLHPHLLGTMTMSLLIVMMTMVPFGPD